VGDPAGAKVYAPLESLRSRWLDQEIGRYRA
jgi:hypothetical protein